MYMAAPDPGLAFGIVVPGATMLIPHTSWQLQSSGGNVAGALDLKDHADLTFKWDRAMTLCCFLTEPVKPGAGRLALYYCDPEAGNFMPLDAGEGLGHTSHRLFDDSRVSALSPSFAVRLPAGATQLLAIYYHDQPGAPTPPASGGAASSNPAFAAAAGGAAAEADDASPPAVKRSCTRSIREERFKSARLLALQSKIGKIPKNQDDLLAKVEDALFPKFESRVRESINVRQSLEVEGMNPAALLAQVDNEWLPMVSEHVEWLREKYLDPCDRDDLRARRQLVNKKAAALLDFVTSVQIELQRLQSGSHASS